MPPLPSRRKERSARLDSYGRRDRATGSRRFRFALGMCQCDQRRQVLTDASRKALAGDATAIAPAAVFVVQSLGQDARSIGAAAINAAKARLMGKR